MRTFKAYLLLAVLLFSWVERVYVAEVTHLVITPYVMSGLETQILEQIQAAPGENLVVRAYSEGQAIQRGQIYGDIPLAFSQVNNEVFVVLSSEAAAAQTTVETQKAPTPEEKERTAQVVKVLACESFIPEKVSVLSWNTDFSFPRVPGCANPENHALPVQLPPPQLG